jgi:hypothetical protein
VLYQAEPLPDMLGRCAGGNIVHAAGSRRRDLQQNYSTEKMTAFLPPLTRKNKLVF